MPLPPDLLRGCPIAEHATDWPEWSALAEQLPALGELLEELRDYLKLHRDPVLCWYGPHGLRARVRDTIAAARAQGLDLTPNAELVAVDRLVGELFSRRSAIVDSWNGTLH